MNLAYSKYTVAASPTPPPSPLGVAFVAASKKFESFASVEGRGASAEQRLNVNFQWAAEAASSQCSSVWWRTRFSLIFESNDTLSQKLQAAKLLEFPIIIITTTTRERDQKFKFVNVQCGESPITVLHAHLNRRDRLQKFGKFTFLELNGPV